MKRLAVALLAVSALPFPLRAQGRDRSLERISLALQDPRSNLNSADAQEPLLRSTRQMLGAPVFEPLPGAVTLGPFALGTPQLRGEIIRVSLPIGDLVSRAVRGVSAANRRRHQSTVRRQVEAELESLANRPPQR